MTERRSVVIVGSGPAGTAAAIQLARCGRSPLLIERRAVGGLLHNAHRVENYPGLPRPLSGPALCKRLSDHLERLGVTPLRDEVVEIAPLQDDGCERFLLRLASGDALTARTVIVATGTRPVTGLVPGEAGAAGQRIFHEIRDAIEAGLCRSGARAAILGGGDCAYDYALNLTERGLTVTLLRRGPPRALGLLLERCAAAYGVRELAPCRITECRASMDRGEARGLVLRLAGAGPLAGADLPDRLEADLLLVACGRTPEDSVLAGLPGYPDRTPPGMHRVGDLVRGDFRQAVIAAGDGLAAAMAVERALSESHSTEGASS